MKFALDPNDNQSRILPEKGKIGLCPVCRESLIPKCGTKRMHHWAHRSILTCDPWWENETEWHRRWKNEYPETWQEIICHDDATGEKHVADVKTDKGLVLEFQHSPFSNEERRSRETYYRNMIWVVDLRRLKRISRAFECLASTRQKAYLGLRNWLATPDQPQWCDYLTNADVLPNEWRHSSVPVVFDLTDYDTGAIQDDSHPTLWCLLPENDPHIDLGRLPTGARVLMPLTRNQFIRFTREAGSLFAQPAPAHVVLNRRNILPRSYWDKLAIRRASGKGGRHL